MISHSAALVASVSDLPEAKVDKFIHLAECFSIFTPKDVKGKNTIEWEAFCSLEIDFLRL
jgi:hypothetical protein